MAKLVLIVAKIVPGCEAEVARIFAESDATELPQLAGVRHRSLFVLEDLYVHLIESDNDPAATISAVREHPLFRAVSEKLAPYIRPYNPATWRSPLDAVAVEFYTWDAGPEAGPPPITRVSPPRSA